MLNALQDLSRDGHDVSYDEDVSEGARIFQKLYGTLLLESSRDSRVLLPHTLRKLENRVNLQNFFRTRPQLRTEADSWAQGVLLSEGVWGSIALVEVAVWDFGEAGTSLQTEISEPHQTALKRQPLYFKSHNLPSLSTGTRKRPKLLNWGAGFLLPERRPAPWKGGRRLQRLESDFGAGILGPPADC